MEIVALTPSENLNLVILLKLLNKTPVKYEISFSTLTESGFENYMTLCAIRVFQELKPRDSVSYESQH
jgi:hypothetical protein